MVSRTEQTAYETPQRSELALDLLELTRLKVPKRPTLRHKQSHFQPPQVRFHMDLLTASNQRRI